MRRRAQGWPDAEYRRRRRQAETWHHRVDEVDQAVQAVVQERGGHHLFPHKAVEKFGWQVKRVRNLLVDVQHDPTDAQMATLQAAVHEAVRLGDVVVRAAVRAR